MLRRPDGDLRHPEATAATPPTVMVQQLMIAPSSPAPRCILSGNAEPGASQHVWRVLNFSTCEFSGPANGVANLSDRLPPHPNWLSQQPMRLHQPAEPLLNPPDRTASPIQTP